MLAIQGLPAAPPAPSGDSRDLCGVTGRLRSRAVLGEGGGPGSGILRVRWQLQAALVMDPLADLHIKASESSAVGRDGQGG